LGWLATPSDAEVVNQDANTEQDVYYYCRPVCAIRKPWYRRVCQALFVRSGDYPKMDGRYHNSPLVRNDSLCRYHRYARAGNRGYGGKL